VHIDVSAFSTADSGLPQFTAELHAVGGAAGQPRLRAARGGADERRRRGEAFAAGLRELGCGLSLDDFGTGEGSLDYLRRLPADTLKIDVDFVRDLSSNEAHQRLVRTIVDGAHRFGKETIAAGVEDRQTLALLRDYGVDYAQGFYIRSPAAIERSEAGAMAVARERRLLTRSRPTCADALLTRLERSWAAA
jgi:EAL domain-containing protein (putative c-di-GMP-specific phosphodiesterase class I)